MKRANKSIVVLAARTQDELAKSGADVEVRNYDTIAEAKKRAKYFLTEEYKNASEASERLGYSQVLVNDECVADYFATPKLTPAQHNAFPNGRWS